MADLLDLIAAHDAAMAAHDAVGDDYDHDDDVSGRAVDAARDALLDHRPASLDEVRTKAAYMAANRTFVEWDNFDQARLIHALTPVDEPDPLPTGILVVDGIVDSSGNRVALSRGKPFFSTLKGLIRAWMALYHAKRSRWHLEVAIRSLDRFECHRERSTAWRDGGGTLP